MRIDVDDGGLIADLTAEVATIEAKETRAVTSEAQKTALRMKANIARETGRAADSIGADLHGLEADVGPTVDYAGFIEYGTSRQAPQPFLGQSTDEAGFEKAVDDAVGL